MTPVQHFDAIITLVKPFGSQSIMKNLKPKKEEEPKFKNVGKMSVDYYPVERYLAELKETFGEACEFFYDTCMPGYVALKWRMNEDQKFKVGLSYSFEPTEEEKVVTPNSEAMLAEMCKIGEGLVEGVIMN